MADMYCIVFYSIVSHSIEPYSIALSTIVLYNTRFNKNSVC